MKTWNIYGPVGHYIGQMHAHNAETAFCDYMALVSGQPRIKSHEITTTEIEPSVCEITYNSKVFTVRSLTLGRAQAARPVAKNKGVDRE
jgi:hypothetical protein